MKKCLQCAPTRVVPRLRIFLMTQEPCCRKTDTLWIFLSGGWAVTKDAQSDLPLCSLRPGLPDGCLGAHWWRPDSVVGRVVGRIPRIEMIGRKLSSGNGEVGLIDGLDGVGVLISHRTMPLEHRLLQLTCISLSPRIPGDRLSMRSRCI